MGDLIRPARVEVITKEGECKLHIVIDLNINLNTSVDNKSKDISSQEEEAIKWAIPSFVAGEKVKFGKKE